MPTFEEVLEQLEHLADTPDIDPDAPLASLDVDSLDLLEWVWAIEDDHQLDIDQKQLAELAGDDTVSLRVVYDKLVRTARSVV